MKLSRVALASAVLFAGCFDEGGDDAAQAKTIETLVQGLVAFGDIHSNLETDPGAAGAALLDFIKWPVAADALLSPPFAGASEVMEASPRLAPNSPVPACLAQNGEPACDMYSTTDTCEAGGFTFNGVMNRKCSKCDDPRGLCAYSWTLSELKFTGDQFTLGLRTSGSWIGRVGQIFPNLAAVYDLRLPDNSEKAGNLSACACTQFTVVDSPTESKKPRKLVNSSFIVRLIKSNESQRCGLVEFDGNGNASVSDKCTCPDGSSCTAPDPTSGWDINHGDTLYCGDGRCDASISENYQSCPVDCALNPPVCGNDICEIGETRDSCAADCSGIADNL